MDKFILAIEQNIAQAQSKYDICHKLMKEAHAKNDEVAVDTFILEKERYQIEIATYMECLSLAKRWNI
jgi:hypothetical protein